MSYDRYYSEEKQKTEVDDTTAVCSLEDCMLERNRRHSASRNAASRRNAPPPTNFTNDGDLGDIWERKQAAYSSSSRKPPPTTYHRHLNSRPSARETILELSPGVYARLRGAKETWQCIENDFHMPVNCYACSKELCVIQDAAYVLCPSCRSVSPVEQDYSNHPFFHHHQGGLSRDGVGLGFTFEELFQWQAQIIRRRTDMMRERNNEAA